MNYNNYPYNYQNQNYGGYQQPTYQNNYNYTQPQTIYQPLAFVNGIEGAKAFIVNPNQTIYLMDSDSNTLFIKSADMQGKYTLKAFRLTSNEVNNVNNNIPTDYVTKDDFVVFKNEILTAIKGVESHE